MCSNIDHSDRLQCIEIRSRPTHYIGVSEFLLGIYVTNGQFEMYKDLDLQEPLSPLHSDIIKCNILFPQTATVVDVIYNNYQIQCMYNDSIFRQSEQAIEGATFFYHMLALRNKDDDAERQHNTHIIQEVEVNTSIPTNVPSRVCNTTYYTSFIMNKLTGIFPDCLEKLSQNSNIIHSQELGEIREYILAMNGIILGMNYKT